MKKMVSCPHCRHALLDVPPLPKDVVAVLVCRECQEWSALYHGRMIPLKRQILERGGAEEKREYLAQIMAQIMADAIASLDEASEIESPAQSDNPITDEEFQAFREEELDRLDDPEFFHRVFG